MKPIAVIYGTEEYLMEQARRRFVADCQQRSGGDAAVRQFKKDAPAAAVVEAFEGTSLFGGGSVVVHDIPDNVVAVGNPCRPVRPITAADAALYGAGGI